MEVDMKLMETLSNMEKEEKKGEEDALNENNDPDFLFCKSLVPILQGLPPKKNRYAKIKMQELLYQIEFDVESTNST